MHPGRFPGGAQNGPLTVASSRTWRGLKDSAAPVPPGRLSRIPQVSRVVNHRLKDFSLCESLFLLVKFLDPGYHLAYRVLDHIEAAGRHPVFADQAAAHSHAGSAGLAPGGDIFMGWFYAAGGHDF